jgi:hypothetical protein
MTISERNYRRGLIKLIYPKNYYNVIQSINSIDNLSFFPYSHLKSKIDVLLAFGVARHPTNEEINHILIELLVSSETSF